MTKKKTPGVLHVPTSATRKKVQIHTMVGTPQVTVARIIGIDDKTLRKHYRDELDLATAIANASVCGSLFNKATIGDDTAAMLFWMKTRAGWSENSGAENSQPITIEIINPHG